MQECVDCRGIKLTHSLKIGERVIERRLRDKQFGFMSIFAVRQRMEKHRGKQDCMVFIIDQEKTYDRVPRQEAQERERRKVEISIHV